MALEGVKQCCVSLTSEKVTERKNGSEKLRSLLNNTSIVSSLNTRSSDSFNWSQVFLSSRKYFLAEARKLEEEERTKPNVSQTVLRSRENQKRTAASLPFLVLKKACRATPHITSQLVIEFVLKGLNKRNPYLLENFAGEYLQITLKFVLRFRQYYADMTPDNWRDLLKICIWLYDKSIANADPQSVFCVMAGVVRHCQTRVRRQRVTTRLEVLRFMPGFLRKALLSDRLSSQLSLRSSLLKLLLAFTSAMACEWRQLLCRLGEETFDVVLAMWDERPSAKQTLWLEYMSLMVTLHHPQKEGEAFDRCQYSGDKDRWDRCMRHLYQLLHDHLARRVKRGLAEGGGGGGCGDLLPKPLLELATRVCLQIFAGSETSGFIDVTQMPSTSSSRNSTCRKRRKIEVGLVPLADLLRSEGTLPHTLPWYQVVLSLLTDHPQFFTEGRCSLLLEALKEVLAACGEASVQDMAMRCLSALSEQYSRVAGPCQGDGTEDSGTNPWAPVWDLTLRLVSGRQNSTAGLTLMENLIRTGLIAPEQSAFELFRQNYSEVNEEALRTLLALLTAVPLPRHFENEPAWVQKNQVKSATERLVQYVLPSYTNGQGATARISDFANLKNPGLLAKVLCCLCVREPHSMQVNFHSLQNHHIHHIHPTDTARLIARVEDLFHLSTFTCELPAAALVTQRTRQDRRTPAKPVGGGGAEGGGGGAGGGAMRDQCFVVEKREFVVQEILKFVEKVEAEASTSPTEGVEALIHLAELLTLLHMAKADERLEVKFRHTMRLITSSLERLCAESEASRWRTLHPILGCLLHLFADHEAEEQVSTKEPAGRDRRKHILSLTPPALFGVMLSLLEGRCAKTGTAADGAQLTRGNSMNQASSLSDFDLDFDETLPSTSVTIREELLDFEDDLAHQVEEEQVDENITVDDDSTYSLRDQCVVLAGRWIVEASAVTCGGGGGGGSGGDTQYSFLHRAVDLILQLSLAPGMEMADVALILKFVQSLFVADYSEDNILDGLEVISNVARVHCAVTQVARCALNSLAELIRRHGPTLSPDARSSALTLTKAFAIKQKQGSYGRSVAEAIFHVNTELTKVDPTRQWSHYEVPEHDRCSKIHDHLCSDSHELRVRAAAATHLLLVSRGAEGDVTQLDASHQDRVFEEVYQMVLEALSVSDLPSEDLAPDEKGNRIASFLLTLGTVALSSPYLEAKALFALCLSIPAYKVEAPVLLQLLECISRTRGTSPQTLLASHLPYLTTQWLQHHHAITAFPWASFGYRSVDTFLAGNRIALVPVLLECDQKAALDDLGESCRKGVKDVLVEAFPLLMARIFPYIAAEQATVEGLQLSEVKIQAGKRQYKQVERTLGTDTFTSMLTGHIGDITLHLLRLAHQPQPWVEGEVVVPPPPPFFLPDAIHATLNFVGGIFRQDGLLLVFLAGRRKELHKVLLGLLEHLSQGTSPHTARCALTATAVFVEAVLPHLSTHLSQVSHYLVRMLLHLLSCHLPHLGHLSPHLSHRCTHLLHRVLEAVLTHLPAHLPPALPTLFGRLLPLLTQPGGVGAGGAARVLHLLLQSNQPEVRATLATLPALPLLPDNTHLASLHQQHQQLVAACRGLPDLLDEVDNFLAATQEAVATHHLTHLTTLLRDTRGQVAELFAGAGPGRESRGHRLAHRLVSLAAGAEEGVALEACRCLGELGPLSLATPVFLTREGGPDPPQMEDGMDLGYVGRIMLALNGYLTCGDVQVEKAASQAMMGVLATYHGQQTLQGLPQATVEELRPLLPEGRPKTGAAGSVGVDVASYQQIVGNEEVWVGCEGYESWVCGLAGTLISAGCGSDLATPLLPVCDLRHDFSALLLPFLVHSALATDTGGRRDVLSGQLSAFFARHCEGGPATAPGGARHSKAAIQTMLDVVDYLRQHQPKHSIKSRGASTPFDNNLWLNINYLQVARAAHYCGAHFSALLYLQLHQEQMLRDTAPERGQAAITRRLQAPPASRVAGHSEAEAAGRLLLEVYGALGDEAGVEGCLAAGGVLDGPARLMRCQNRGEWLAALAVCDASHHGPGLVQTLSALGLYNTLGGVLAAACPGPRPGKARWEAAWRLCRWEEEGGQCRDVRGVGTGEEGRFHQHLFEAIRSIHQQDLQATHQHTILARHTITHTLRLNRTESTSLVYPILTQLQVLNEIEEAARCLDDLACPEKVRQCVLDLEGVWRAKEGMGSTSYVYKEEVMAARVSVLKALSGICKDEELQRILHRTLLAKSKLARVAGDKGGHSIVGSESAILWASQLALPPELTNLTRLEEAEVARAAGDVQRARHILQALLGDMEGQQGRGQERALSQVLTLLGELLMDRRSLPPHTIIKDYFYRATSTLLHHHATDRESRDALENSHQRLAQYVDQLYQQVTNHLDSDASQAKRANIRRSQEELARLGNLVKTSRENTNEWRELSKKMVLLQRNVNIDCVFLSELENEQQQYLAITLKAYLNCLAMTSKHDLHTYRVVALWLQNCDKEEINRMIADLGRKVKSHHFVPLLYQLVARLSTQHTQQPHSFSSVLSQLLVRVCKEHPHHALPVIFALAHAHADDQFLHAGRKTNVKSTEEDRVQAAKVLVEGLKKTAALQGHVLEFERISLAYLSMANWCTSLGKLQAGDKVEIPHSQPLRTLSHLQHTAALTQPLKLQSSAQYSPPLIQDWEKAGMCVGGINAPVRLTIRTSDGAKNFELLKGKDDVRQDAVMEQVFGIVNELLMRSTETRDCGLSVRTYQVVPLSQRSGLIQWCRNTQSFGKYLIGADRKSGAHKVYYPKDYPARVCIEKMKAVKERSAEEKLNVFVDILENFHPVFHHFFLENYPSPQEWHQRRLSYTKSVATNSMVGYILGLGDRHPENILLDKTTAELIHIDLGIAFEFGKVLPTPETVPFRMTQDIIAGLGVLGVEGPLRWWSEATLRVLRASGEVLVTLVEVLRHDPLHQWTLTPQQAAKLQASGDEEDQGFGCQNSVSMAERVVLTLRQKLVGMEEGFPCSVPDQVTRLLQEATNPSNLSRLFAGWQAHV